MKTRSFFLSFLVAALLLAGVVSYYASANPDGLVHVAESTGFLDTAEDHAADDGPLSGYSVKGVEDPRLSGGAAGIIGSLSVLLLAGGLAWVVRRREKPEDSPGRAAHPSDSRESAGPHTPGSS